jgi:2Fe-2S ferredoxin
VREIGRLSELHITVVDRLGSSHRLQAGAGEVLMPLLRDQIDITIGTCGGVLSCGTCLVILDEGAQGRFAPPSQDEQDLLEALDAPATARLACQLVLGEAAEDLQLTIAPEA